MTVSNQFILYIQYIMLSFVQLLYFCWMQNQINSNSKNNDALFERLMEINSNPPIIYYGFNILPISSEDHNILLTHDQCHKTDHHFLVVWFTEIANMRLHTAT